MTSGKLQKKRKSGRSKVPGRRSGNASDEVLLSSHPNEVKRQVPQKCEDRAFEEGTAGVPVLGRKVLGMVTHKRDGTRQVRRKEAERMSTR